MNRKSSLSILIGIIILLLVAPESTFANSKYPVRITEQNMIVFPIDVNTVEVVQITTFKNSGNSKETQLPIYLPKDYANLQIRGGLEKENMQTTDKGIIDTSGLSAGEEKQITISYQMPINKKIARWSNEQSYVTERVQIVIQPGVLSLSTNDLITQSDLFEMNGQEFRRFTRLNIHPGESWAISFRLLVDLAASVADTPSNNNETIKKDKMTEDGFRIIGQEGIGYGKAAITITIIIIAFSAAFIGLRRDLQKTIGTKKKVHSSWLKKEKHVLLEEITQLENDYQEKLIGNETYETTKKKLRNQLIQISTELKKREIG